MFNGKRAQKAVKLLMIYVWAILATVVAIGSLGYLCFTSGDMDVNMTELCASNDVKNITVNFSVLNAPFYAQAWQVSTSQIQIGIKNNGQDTVTVTGVEIKGTDGAFNCSWSGSQSLASGSVFDVTANTCSGTISAGSTYKGDIVAKYTRTGSAIELTSTGSVSSKVI